MADIAAITKLAKTHGALTVMDNTFAGFHQHGEFDVDVFVHSLTKYASGTGDVMGGAAIARPELVRLLRTDFGALGVALDPHAAFLIQRGLKTYFVRYSAQCARALRIAQILASHPSRGACALSRPAGSSAACARDQADERIWQHREFRSQGRPSRLGVALPRVSSYSPLTASLGSTESLVVAPQMMTGRDLSAEHVRLSGVTEGTVRLSIGLEDEEDLVADVLQALDGARVRCG